MKNLLNTQQIHRYHESHDSFQSADFELRETCKELVTSAVTRAGGKVTLDEEFIDEHDEYIDFQLPYSKRLGQGDRVAALDAQRIYSFDDKRVSQRYQELDTETWISLVETIVAYQRWRAATGS